MAAPAAPFPVELIETIPSPDEAVSTSGVLVGKKVTAIAAGYGHSLALCSDGTLVAWGDNSKGELGNDRRPAPVAVYARGVLAGRRMTAIAAGNGHSLALCSDGTLAAWGDNSYGQLGNNSTTRSPVPVAVNFTGALSGKTITAVVAGGGYSRAVCSDGTMACWGLNTGGVLGNDSTVSSLEPVAVCVPIR